MHHVTATATAAGVVAKMIETTVPIPLDQLKQYFQDRSISFMVDYSGSTLKGDKFLTYLGNLDVPADVKFDPASEDGAELLRSYFSVRGLVKLPALEQAALEVLLEARELDTAGRHAAFIETHRELIDTWLNVIDSLTLYNMHIVNILKFKEWVAKHPRADSSSVGLNFVNLLKHEEVYRLYEKLDAENLKFYPDLFEEYIFKGQNLFTFWSSPNNPLFLLTAGIAQGEIKQGETK